MASYRNNRAITEIYVVLCLLGSFEQVASLMCYFCAGTNSKSPCLDASYFLDGFKDTDGNPQMFKNCMAPFNNSCIIEEYRAGGQIASHIRDCSDGLTFAYPAKEPVYDSLRSEAKTPRNRTACIYNSNVQVCLTACNTDFCNGPQYDSAGHLIGYRAIDKLRAEASCIFSSIVQVCLSVAISIIVIDQYQR